MFIFRVRFVRFLFAGHDVLFFSSFRFLPTRPRPSPHLRPEECPPSSKIACRAHTIHIYGPHGSVLPASLIIRDVVSVVIIQYPDGSDPVVGVVPEKRNETAGIVDHVLVHLHVQVPMCSISKTGVQGNADTRSQVLRKIKV